MALYLLADFIVDIQNRYDFLEKQCLEYRYNADAPADFTIRVTDEDIRKEYFCDMEDHNLCGYLESICAYRQLCTQLPLYDAMLMHGSIIAFDGRGIGFLARSGVGKTTHTMRWKQVYGDRVQIINGDKPIIRFLGDIPYAYGTPWAGKENLQKNDRVALTDICLIERSTENSVTKADPTDCINALMQQVLHPSELQAAEKSLELLDRLLTKCNFWIIKCNISDEAAIIAHNTILGDA